MWELEQESRTFYHTYLLVESEGFSSIFLMVHRQLSDEPEKTISIASRRTEVIHGSEIIIGTIMNFFANAKTQIDICASSVLPNLSEATHRIGEACLSAGERGLRLRLVTEITEENVDLCKELAKNLEIRHISGLSGNLGVSDSEYVATIGKGELGLDSPLLYSNESNFVKHHQALFNTLWESSIPAAIRIRSIEQKLAPVETRFIRTPSEIDQAISSFIERAGSSVKGKTRGHYLYWIASKNAPAAITSFLNQLQKVHENEPDFKLQFILDIQHENLEHMEKIIQSGIEVRHIEGNNIRFLVSGSEQISVISGRFGKDGSLPKEILVSNNSEQVVEWSEIFLSLWQNALPADIRIKQLKEGFSFGETRITFDTQEIFGSANRLLDEMKEEALILVSREGSISENVAFFNHLAASAKRTGAKIRILGRLSADEEKLLKAFNLKGLLVRKLVTNQELGLALGIYDRKGMGLVQYIYPDSPKKLDTSYLCGIISADTAITSGIAAVFESLWEESEMLDREEKNRKNAELMQDILTHDLRNRNQVILLCAELLQTELKDHLGEDLVEKLMKSVTEANDLLEKAARLGKVVLEKDAPLYPVDLIQVIYRSMELVERRYPEKKITLKLNDLSASSEGNGRASVHADGLLGEVFVNLLANSTIYSKNNEAEIEILIEKIKEPFLDQVSSFSPIYLKVSVSDKGIGIPDDVKNEMFGRYLRTAKGTGLGLSIVKALVVDRYKGKIRIMNRIADDYTKGTTVEVLIPEEE